MPITIKTAELAYKNNSGQYVGVNCISEQTAAEQIEAIEAAGAHVLEDVIPHDWTELSEEFDQIKSRVEDINTRKAELPVYPTRNGTYFLKATVNNGTTILSWEAQE
jgi:tetrahydromethanopterin S-methyltransferase subunit B